MNNVNPSRVIVAEFHKSAGGRFRLFSFTLLDERGYYRIYDVEWSKAYGYIYDMTGAGGSSPLAVSGPYFISGNIAVRETPTQLVDARDKPPWKGKRTRAIRERNRTRRLRALPKEFAVEPWQDLLDWLHRNAIEQDAVWCSTCSDWFPEEETCDHVWWCDKTGWWSTPSKRCKCKDRDACRE